MTKEIEGVVQEGKVVLPKSPKLPDGCKVRVLWEDSDANGNQPYDREPLSERDVQADIDWAKGKRL